MTAREALNAGAAQLTAAGVGNPRLDARLLLAYAEGCDQAALLGGTRIVDAERYAAVIARRVAREPLAYIIGRQEFWSLDFAVSPATIIPRPDSETVVEAALDVFPYHASGAVLDLGTGTGCLLLAILHERRKAWGVGVDLAPEAAQLAAANAAALGLADRASFVAGCWDRALAGRFSLIVTNPPYIERDAVARLQPDIARWEPRRALDGGADGLHAYRELLAALPQRLLPGGYAVVELGAGQIQAVSAIACASGFQVFATRADLGGHIRALTLTAVLDRRPCSLAPA